MLALCAVWLRGGILGNESHTRGGQCPCRRGVTARNTVRECNAEALDVASFDGQPALDMHMELFVEVKRPVV